MLVMSFCSWIHYKLCSKNYSDLSNSINWQFFHYKLSNPINHQFWHLMLHQAQRSTAKFSVTCPNLIFTKKWDIQHLLFFLSFSYHRDILYKPHCQQCWVMFAHSNHAILAGNIFQVMQQNITMSFPTLYIANSNITVAFSSRDTPKFGVTPLSYL